MRAFLGAAAGSGLLVPVTAASAGRVEGPFGRGDGQVWLVLPRGPVRSIVVFGHGWKVAPPSASQSWVGQFRPWLDHLTAAGSAVLFPRYQLGVNDVPGLGRVAAYRRGLHEGFKRLDAKGVPVVAEGYSYGASLALTYAAEAPAWRLPRPAAVDAVFPAGMIPGAPMPRLPGSMQVLIQVGDRDAISGAGGAAQFWSWLRSHPRPHKRYEIVRSAGAFVATHAAPKLRTLAARRAFWAPLDSLIAVARRTPKLA
jgi:pimeloyl-ACP methyl ester carboxylesterase